MQFKICGLQYVVVKLLCIAILTRIAVPEELAYFTYILYITICIVFNIIS